MELFNRHRKNRILKRIVKIVFISLIAVAVSFTFLINGVKTVIITITEHEAKELMRYIDSCHCVNNKTLSDTLINQIKRQVR